MKQLFNKVEEALQGIKRYHLRMESGNESGYISDGDVDVEGKATHFTIKIGRESPQEVEYYWIGEKAYGLPLHVGKWFQVWVPAEPVSRLHLIFAILKTGEVTSVQEEALADDRCWVLLVTPDLSPLRDHAEEFANLLFLRLSEGSERDKELLASLKEAMREAEMQAEFWISQETHHIKKAIIKTFVSGAETQMTYYISHINDLELQISPPARALEAEGPPMPLGVLFLKFDIWGSHSSFWGWSENNHCMMTEEALKLIKKNDPDGKYQEIYYGYPNKWGTIDWSTKSDPSYYNPKPNSSEPGDKDHPCVLGAWSEDAWDKVRTRDLLDPDAMKVKEYRSFRHFGGEDKGLKYEDYFSLVDKKVTLPKGGRYISARDWGKEDGTAHAKAGESGDKMNFQGAIDAYNHYTYDGKKEAYRRIGHVLHLLQDVAQPDHAGLWDHAGSGMNEGEAYDRFHVCEAKVAAAFEIGTAVCATSCAAFLIGYLGCLAACEAVLLWTLKNVWLICQASKSSSEVGFEYLLREHWNFNNRPGIRQKLKIKKEASYDVYFKKMANESITAAKVKGLKSPLGLGSQLITIITGFVAKAAPYSEIPGLDPDIELGHPVGTGEEKKYLELADEVIIKATNRCAGLLQHFYEIVNFPPYVKAVTVARGVPGLSAEDVLLKPQNFIYSAKWKDELVSSNFGPKTKISSRKLVITKGEPISITELGQRIYVIAEVSNEMKKLNLGLKNCIDDLIDKEAMTDVTVPISTSLYGLYEKDTYYYFASFAVPLIYAGLSSNVCNAVVLEFTGEDDKPHFSKRNYSGKKLDSEPGTLAVAGNLSPYDWIGYEPGTDKNHKIRVISPNKHEPNNDLAHATPIKYTKNMQQLLTGGETYYDLTLHDSSDIDFFSLQLPPKTKADIKCANTLPANIPSDVEKIPGSLTIRTISVDCHRNLSEGSPIITIYKKDNNPYTFPTTSQIEKKPGYAGVTLYEKDLVQGFQNNTATFI